MTSAEKLERLNHLLGMYDETDKAVIMSNINRAFELHYGRLNRSGNRRTTIICNVTGTVGNTVMNWGNSSMKSKIPFIKLVQLALALDVPVENLLSTDTAWLDDPAMQEKLKNQIKELEEKLPHD